METNSSYRNYGLMAFVFGAIMLIFSMTVNAQWRDRDDDDYYRNNGRVYGRQNGRWGNVSQRDLRKAYERGYKRGEKDGRRDARDNRGGYYGNGRYGNGGYGNRGYGTYGGNGRYNGGYYGGGQIQRAYQDGYRQGYQNGYDRNSRYNRNSRYRYGNRSIFGIPLPY